MVQETLQIIHQHHHWECFFYSVKLSDSLLLELLKHLSQCSVFFSSPCCVVCLMSDVVVIVLVGLWSHPGSQNHKFLQWCSTLVFAEIEIYHKFHHHLVMSVFLLESGSKKKEADWSICTFCVFFAALPDGVFFCRSSSLLKQSLREFHLFWIFFPVTEVKHYIVQSNQLTCIEYLRYQLNI